MATAPDLMIVIWPLTIFLSSIMVATFGSLTPIFDFG